MRRARGSHVGARFLDVVLLSYLFVLTTEPNLLAYGLMQVGLPYRFGFALVTALRLVPVFEKEGETVYRAQLARGIAYIGQDHESGWCWPASSSCLYWCRP